MAFEKGTDALSGREFEVCHGTIEKVWINDIDNPKTYQGKNGGWTPTKRYAIVVDEARIGIGMGEKDTVSAKDKDGKWHTLSEGMGVRVVITRNGDFINAKSSNVIVTSPAPADAPKTQSGGQGKTYQKSTYDKVGVQVGHAQTCALKLYGINATVGNACELHNLTRRMEKEFLEQNPNEKNAGARVGHAVKYACEVCSGFNQIEQMTLKFLADSVQIDEYIRGGAKQNKQPEQPRQQQNKPETPPLDSYENDMDMYEGDDEPPF